MTGRRGMHGRAVVGARFGSGISDLSIVEEK
jgi:hypothetical protein